jgi:FtsH-binding integral membrane protein
MIVLSDRNPPAASEFSPRHCRREIIMNIRSWTALALVALAVVALYFALSETHSDPESAPGRAASQETIKQIPSNPDTVTPR